MPKLVRDRIPEIIRANGQEPIIHTADANEYKRLLAHKLFEECAEAIQATSEDECLAELADVLEVVYAVTESIGYQIDDLHRVADAKFEARGGFKKRIVWHGNEPKGDDND